MKAEKKLSPKVKALYEAVEELIFENIDVKEIKVSDITERAGIGKGTAYEYFRNKEEIISSAMLYHIDLICRQMIEKLEELKDFPKTMQLLLCCMDEEIKKRDCLVQFIHLLSDNGLIGKVLQKKIKERNQELCMPKDVIAHMIQVGIENGDINKELPLDYVSMEIASRVLIYIIYITDDDKNGCSRQQMHKLVCDAMRKALK
ncbi:MAG: TetR/AcrR family transcriptional regulator [Lachnospiraceae bacterium]|jgi:AcrR family transcriptional regulator|nr:TetR/AcrR family transcriptional regulator [Lachnospiraceae bacterium]